MSDHCRNAVQIEGCCSVSFLFLWFFPSINSGTAKHLFDNSRCHMTSTKHFFLTFFIFRIQLWCCGISMLHTNDTKRVIWCHLVLKSSIPKLIRGCWISPKVDWSVYTIHTSFWPSSLFIPWLLSMPRVQEMVCFLLTWRDGKDIPKGVKNFSSMMWWIVLWLICIYALGSWFGSCREFHFPFEKLPNLVRRANDIYFKEAHVLWGTVEVPLGSY